MKLKNILKSNIFKFILLCLCGLLSSGCFVINPKKGSSVQNVNEQGPPTPPPPPPLPVLPEKTPSKPTEDLVPAYHAPSINTHTNTEDLSRPDERPTFSNDSNDDIIETSRINREDNPHLEYSIPYANQTCARVSQTRVEPSIETNTGYFTTKTALIVSASIAVGAVTIAGAVTMLPTLIPMMTTPLLAVAPMAGDALVVGTGTNHLIGLTATGLTIIEALRRGFLREQASMRRTFDTFRRVNTPNIQLLVRQFFHPGNGHRGFGGGPRGCGGGMLAPAAPVFYIPLLIRQQEPLLIEAPTAAPVPVPVPVPVLVPVPVPVPTPAVAVPDLGVADLNPPPLLLHLPIINPPHFLPLAPAPEPSAPVEELDPPVLEIPAEVHDDAEAFALADTDTDSEAVPPIPLYWPLHHPAYGGPAEAPADLADDEEQETEEEEWVEVDLGPSADENPASAAPAPSTTTAFTLVPITSTSSNIQDIKKTNNARSRISKKVRTRLEKPFEDEASLTDHLVSLDPETQVQLDGFIVAVGHLPLLQRGLHALGSKRFTYKYYSIRISHRLF